MILSEQSIEQVRDLSIKSVLSHYLKFNRSNMACCPFHNERSPSFHVSEKKNIFKCFGCGEAGDAIAFVMKRDRLPFIDAVEHIASLEGVSINYEEVADQEKWEAQKSAKEEMRKALDYTVTTYRTNLWNLPAEHPAAQYIRSRHLSRKEVAEWQLGWAGTDWRSITPHLVNNKLYTPAESLGIVKRSKADDSNYDGYRSRITLPITDHVGRPLGLAGRFLAADPADAGKAYPKYINPPENELYHKSKVLFGLDKAVKSINQLGFAFLVEGYFDVISLHKVGDTNSVGTCGTALTIDQAKLLRRYTSRIVLLRDGDAAGIKAAKNDLKVLLKEGFKVEVALLPQPEDPDSYIRKLDSYNDPRPYLNGVHFDDAILWYVKDLVRDASGDNALVAEAKQKTLELLAGIPNELTRSQYFDSIIKNYKWKDKSLQKMLNDLTTEKEEAVLDDEGTHLDRLPKWMDKEEFLRNGFCSVRNDKRCGYYSFSGSGQTEITNFIITPIFHIYKAKESRHMIQIDNGRKKAVMEIESKALISIDLLAGYVVSEGNFLIFGSKLQMLRVASTLLQQFPTCYEIDFLGWQREGFFAYVDRIFVPGQGLKELDQWGIFPHGHRNFLIPAASAAYEELRRSGDDPYENERCLTYLESSITFESWARKMQRVYGDKGVTAVAFVILTLFRDIVFDIDNNCPHLYGFGERSSGKSKWADSICAVFYKKRPAMNLNSGTNFAFFSYMGRFRNCPAQLNEFDEKVINLEWFQAIKGIFDGEGRQRGMMGSRTRTETMKIDSTLVLTGQFLVTMDDNSIVSRSIIEGFHEREISEEDKIEFNELKAWENHGLSALLVELLQHRVSFREGYRELFNETLGKWRHKAEGEFNQRIMQNWCHLATCYRLVSAHIKLPLPADGFESYCRSRGLHWSTFIRNSDTLSEFWNTLSFLVDQGTLVAGWDFKIEEKPSVTVIRGKEEYVHEFTAPTKLLFLRLNNVHKHYQEAFRKRTGKEGMSLENLLHYFSSRKYFLGPSKKVRFKRWEWDVQRKEYPQPDGSKASIAENKREEKEIITSSHIFLFDPLGIDIERSHVGEEQPDDDRPF